MAGIITFVAGKKMNPQITVVIPTYNRAKSLPVTLEKILHQTVPHEVYRIIVVDNRSADNTAEVVKGYADRYPILQYAYQAKPGAAPTRNKGIALATTPLILFIDDDILAQPNLIEEHLKGHRGRKCSVLGYLDVSWEKSDDPFLKYLFESEEQNTFSLLDPYNVSYKYFYTGNVSCRRDALLRVGGFDEGFTVYGVEDIDLGYRMEMSGERMVFNKRASAFHDYRPTFYEFKKKRFNAGRSLAYFLAKYPHIKEHFSFRGHPWLLIALPALGSAWMARFVLRPVKGKISFFRYAWFNRAFRWQMFHGYRKYRDYWNKLGMTYEPSKSDLRLR